MARSLTAEDLLAGASEQHRIALPAGLAPGTAEGEVSLRPLTVRDIRRVTQAAKEQRVLSSVLMVQQALVEPEMTVEQVASLPAGLVRFLLGEVNRVSGLSLDQDDLEQNLRQPLTRACFVLAREFGWTPAECAELTVGQVMLYLEMLARGEMPGEAP